MSQTRGQYAVQPNPQDFWTLEEFWDGIGGSSLAAIYHSQLSCSQLSSQLLSQLAGQHRTGGGVQASLVDKWDSGLLTLGLLSSDLRLSSPWFGPDSDPWWLNWSAVEEACASGAGKDPVGTLGLQTRQRLGYVHSTATPFFCSCSGMIGWLGWQLLLVFSYASGLVVE
eukprot:g66956.t1